MQNYAYLVARMFSTGQEMYRREYVTQGPSARDSKIDFSSIYFVRIYLTVYLFM